MNQRNALLAVVAVVLTVGIAFLLLQERDDVAPFEPTSGGAVTATDATADATHGIATTDAVAPKATDEATAPVRASVAVDEDSQRTRPEGAAEVVVTILDKTTGAPVAGAAVRWYDETCWTHLSETQPLLATERNQELSRNGELLARLAGWRTLSDAEGRARVTLKEETTVLARYEGRFGRLVLRANTQPPRGGHRILLAEDRSVSVRVVDAEGNPVADVPVAVAAIDGDRGFAGSFGFVSSARSEAPHGIATIMHLQELAHEAGKESGGPERNKPLEWRVRLFLTGHTDPGVAFAIDAPPTEPIELRLPACGSVRVRAEFAGKPIPGFVQAWMRHDSEQYDGRHQTHRTGRVGPDGFVRFLHVPLGKSYSSWAMNGLNASFDGPAQPAQEVEVILVPTDQVAVLAGRLLLPDRSPAVERTVRLRLRGSTVRTSQEVRTDATGRFVAIVGIERRDNRENRADEICFELSRKGESTLRADVGPRALRPGLDELGDLLLGDGALLAAGKLVAGGKPFLEPVWLRVERYETADSGRGARWRRVEGALEHKDGQGGFTMRGAAAPGRYRLTVSSQSALPGEPVEFALGAKDLVVNLEAGFAVAASVLLPPKAPAMYLRARWVPATEANLRGRDLTVEPSHSDGERHDLQWTAVPGGDYSLHLSVFGGMKASVVIPDVRIPLPEGGDVRLQEIDLRTAFQVVELELHGPEGLLGEADGVAFTSGQTNPAEWVGQPLYSVRPRLLLPVGNYDLLVCVQGYRPVPLRGSSASAVVRLDRWPTLRVVVADIPQLPEKSRLMVLLQPPTEPGGSTYRTPWSSGERSEYMTPSMNQQTVQNGVAVVTIGDGPHTLSLLLRANRRGHEIEGVEPTQVLSSSGEVVVRAPAAAWKAAVDVVSKPAK